MPDTNKWGSIYSSQSFNEPDEFTEDHFLYSGAFSHSLYWVAKKPWNEADEDLHINSYNGTWTWNVKTLDPGSHPKMADNKQSIYFVTWKENNQIYFYRRYRDTFSGTITQNTMWSGTVTVTGNVTVQSGVTLTILPETVIKFNGNYAITINSGAKVLAEGTESQPITFATVSGTLADKYKYLKLLGGNNSIKWCNFEYGEYPLYLYYCTDQEGTTNIIENCIFRHNSHYGLRIFGSVAKVKSCEMYDNGFYGIHCQYDPEVGFTGDYVHHNDDHGVYAISGSLLKFYGSVIENNGDCGLKAANTSEILLGEPYNPYFYGYNTIRYNDSTEVYAYSGDPVVEMAYSSIHDAAGSPGWEVYNYAGNDQIYTQNCYWDGGTPTCYNYSGDVFFSGAQCSTPTWDGVTRTDGSPLGKVIAGGEGEDWIVDPSLTDEEKVKQLKDILAKTSISAEAKEALFWLFSIIRADYMKNELGEKDRFYDYLQTVKNKFRDGETGKLALRYMIVWKLLENDNFSVIQLSKEALNIMTGEDRKWVLVDLASTYTHAGQLQEARAVLKDLEDYGAGEYLLAMINDDILDIEWQMAEGLFKPNDQQMPLDFPASLPQETDLAQNYPNPGNPATAIQFQLPEASHVMVTIYNLMGQKVRVLVDEYRPSGSHTVLWDGKNQQGMEVSSGIYLYTLHTGDKVFTKKLTLLR
jgi:hypothetical protein